MALIDLAKILKEEIRNGSMDLVTRQSGETVRRRIERDLEKEPGGSVIALDFAKIGIIDYSCADEIVAKLVSRLISGEYGDKYLLLTGLNENQQENIEVALERKDLAVVVVMRDGKRALIGNLNNYLKETMEFIQKKKKVSAKDLSGGLKLEANTSGTRLLNLHKKRLVRRVDTTGADGRVLMYEPLQV